MKIPERVMEHFLTGGEQAPPTDVLAQKGQRWDNRYIIGELLGQGGMGVVYKCWDEWREKEIALKRLHPWLATESQALIRNELEALNTLQHEALVRTYDLGYQQETGEWYFTMEYVEGEDLEATLCRAKEHETLPLFPSVRWLGWLEALCDALSYTHQKGWLHRDLKPSNIMLLRDGSIKLLDFGIALPGQHTTPSGQPTGTAYYMSPEQLEGKGQLTPASDIYALGVIVYRLLTGRLPMGRLQGPWSDLKKAGWTPDFPKEVDEWVLKALETAPRDRYQDIETFWAACQALPFSKVETQTEELRQSPPHPPKNTLFHIDTDKGRLFAHTLFAQGELSTLYKGTYETQDETKDMVIKIVDEIEDNDLMADEIRVYTLLQMDEKDRSQHIPLLSGHFQLPDGRQGLYQPYIDAHNLEYVRQIYPQGVPLEHVIWIFRRCLSVIGYAHHKGIIHGNIDPTHILVRGYDHNVFLLDWSYAIVEPARTGQGFKCWNALYSAPEVKQRKPPVPGSDLYSLARCVIYLLGGDVEAEECPAHVDERFERFLGFFLRKSPLQRARDAWEMYHQLGKLRKEIFGKHKFIPFPIDQHTH